MGKVAMSGIVPKPSAPVPPVKGISGGELAVGNSVFLRVNGVLKEFLIVNQGVPGNSNLYDASCDGMWLLMKDIYQNCKWYNDNSLIDYKDSKIHSILNSTFLNLLDADIKDLIKNVKIPHNKYSTSNTYKVNSGSDGLSTKIFVLSGYELGWTKSTDSYFPVDGACLSYFSGTSATDSKRIARLNGTAARWWTRSPNTYYDYATYSWTVLADGGCDCYAHSTSYGVRPALILPSNALFDPDTMEFIGVA